MRSPKTLDARWQPIQFLFGDWVAAGTGTPGNAVGDYSFKPELNGQIVVRHSFADYGRNSASAGQQGRHDDLLVIYAEAPGMPLRAIYFDSEGHVIRYNLTASPNRAVFDSESAGPAPKFRLTYQLVDKNLNGKFEIAPPGADAYKTYLLWTSIKK